MILTFSNDFISDINKRYNYKGYTQILIGKRFYVTTISINKTPFVLCIPLHSNCQNHFLYITPPNDDVKWKSHGLDYQKMLLLKAEDIEHNAKISGIDNSIWQEILSKEEALTTLVKNYLMYILSIRSKRSKGLILKRQENNDLNYSSLNCFSDYLDELESYELQELEFVFNHFSTLDELLFSLNEDDIRI